MGLAPSNFFLRMGLHQELTVYKASYDLLVEIFRFTKEISKDYKYTVTCLDFITIFDQSAMNQLLMA
jgi:hypothetical protein